MVNKHLVETLGLLKSLEKDYLKDKYFFKSFFSEKVLRKLNKIILLWKATFLGINLYIKRTIRRIRETKSYQLPGCLQTFSI